MEIETEYIDLTIIENTEEEKKMAKLFLEGKVWIYWNEEKKKAEIFPNIFKVKDFDVILKLKKNGLSEGFMEAFLELWKKGKVKIKYDKRLNDFITSEKVIAK